MAPAPHQTRHQNHGRPDQGRSRDRQGGNVRSLPEPNRVTYFKDSAKKILDPTLVDQTARDNAESFVKLKPTQMRRFYDEFKAIERKIDMGKDLQERQANFERDRALIMMFKAKAAYAERRGVAPREFTQFIFDHMASIESLEDFRAFLKVFEAVVAFHRFYSQEN